MRCCRKTEQLLARMCHLQHNSMSRAMMCPVRASWQHWRACTLAYANCSDGCVDGITGLLARGCPHCGSVLLSTATNKKGASAYDTSSFAVSGTSGKASCSPDIAAAEITGHVSHLWSACMPQAQRCHIRTKLASKFDPAAADNMPVLVTRLCWAPQSWATGPLLVATKGVPWWSDTRQA